MMRFAVQNLVTSGDQDYAWVAERPCAICGDPFESLSSVLLGKHWDNDGFTGRDIVLHKECIHDFQCHQDNGFGTYDADSYVLHQFIDEEEAEKLANRLDLTQIRYAIPFSLEAFDPELSGEALWLTDRHGVKAYGVYDGISLYIEVVNKNTSDPMQQQMLEFFGQ